MSQGSGKKRILLCWGYHRKGWVTPFEELNEDFEFVYLFYRARSEEKEVYTTCQRIYWDDFRSGFEVIESVRPQKIILMSVISGYSIALNMAAKRKGVPTYVMQHGLFRTYKEYRSIERNDRKQKKKVPAVGTGGKAVGTWNTLRFLIGSMTGMLYFKLPVLLVFFYFQRRQGIYFASRRIRFRERRPDRYICYTWRNAVIYRELDQVAEENIDYIGVPELDPFFDPDDQRECESRDPYYLLIDQPFAENQYYHFSVTKDQTNAMYGKLADWCGQQGYRLLVKLHPETYGSNWLLAHPNIEYKTDCDIVCLIRKAKGIFGTTSTLMLPAVFLKPVFLLLIHDSSFQSRVLELGLAKGADFSTFREEQINFMRADTKPSAQKQFEFEFLYKADGRSRVRLHDALDQ